jgi:hypothetical protein
MSEDNEAAEISAASPPPRRRPLRRLGCAMGLVIWLILMTLPCIFFMLATRNEITIGLGEMPNQELRIWLIMDADRRGLASSIPAAHSGENDDEVCLQTDVRYFLWQGDADEVITYCECYVRADEDWSFTGVTDGQCE